jgi:hypothetical protein
MISSHPFRYHDQIFIDVNSPGHDPGYDDDPCHEVWKIEDAKVVRMCRLDPTIIRLAPAPR